jgi:hypothetical protein
MKGSAMREPISVKRHHDKYDEISRQHGHTLIGILRRIYGLRFAWNLNSHIKLADALPMIDIVSLDQLVKHHDDGTLSQRIAKASVSDPGCR